MFPVRAVPICASDVTVIHDGPENVNVIASPSGSAARIAWSEVSGAHPPIEIDMFAMGSSTGAAARAGGLQALVKASAATETTSVRIQVAVFISGSRLFS